jgi:signal transduction histidine kinase
MSPHARWQSHGRSQSQSQSRPPWWPANEPWPPVGRGQRWSRGRRRFLRRVALLFAALLALSAIGAGTLLSWLFGRLGLTAVGGGAAPLRHVFTDIALAVALLMPILFLVFFLVMRRVGWPLGDVVSAADRVASGDYSVRVIERGPPFLRLMARSFNSMTAQLQSQDQQRRQLMADIAHELRTPLAVIQGRLEGLVDGVYPRDEQRMTELLDDTKMLARLVEDLRTLANAEAGSLPLRKEPTDLAILLHDAVAAFADEARRKHIDLRVEERTELPLVEIDPVRVREVMVNLLANAMRHTGNDANGGAVTVTGDSRDGKIIVSVTDNGSGIAPEDVPRIFDRFYKGPTSQGSGLGLTIARNLIVAHGGEIHAESQLGRGTVITFTLPVAGG